MPRVRAFSVVILAVGLCVAGQLLPPLGNGRARQHSQGTSLAPSNVQAQAQDAYGKLPMAFEVNAGQTNAAVRFLAHGSGYTLALTPSAALLALSPQPDARALPPLSSNVSPGHAPSPTPSAPSVIAMQWLQAAPTPSITGEDPLPGTVNYFIGNNPAQWRTNILTYARVRYHDIYPGVDLVYYGSAGNLEYDIELAPGADPTRILLGFGGSARLGVDLSGNLSLQLPGGFIQQDHPLIYQQINGTRQPVSGGFQLLGSNRVAFRLGRYDATLPLVIDPVYRYSTYLGGSAGDDAYGIGVDQFGNAYIAGITLSANFPLSNPLQTTNTGDNRPGIGEDGFVSKLNAAGTALIYSTYLGGATYQPQEDTGIHGIAVDPQGDAYITGHTNAVDYPVVNPVQPYLVGGQSSNSEDVIVSKLNPSGSSLLYSTYIGGSFLEAGTAIALDSQGDAYITGWTGSVDFPLKHALQSNLKGGYADAFVTELSATGSSYVYSTFLGGSMGDEGKAIAVDPSGYAYVTGYTASTDFPTINALQSNYVSGSQDAFVTKIKPGGTAFVYSTYLSGGFDYGYGIATDADGDAYVTGQTLVPGIPYTNLLPGSTTDGVFITKLNPSGSALVYGTFVGLPYDAGQAITVDANGNAFVTGYTGDSTFPTVNALQTTYQGCGCGESYGDAFVLELNSTGTALLYSSFLGGTSIDIGNGIAVGSGGNIYVAGGTDSVDFPTHNALQPALGDAYPRSPVGDNFITKFLILPTPIITAGLYRSSNATYYLRNSNTSGAPDLTVTFGASSDISVAGDWTGKGYKSIGIFRNGTWYLRNSNTAGSPDITLQFGAAGDIPVVGDWTGKGYDSVGIFRPSNATFYLRNSNTTGPADIAVRFGSSTDLPVVGDWTGKGYDSVGVYRNGIFYLRNANTTGPANLTVYFGASGDTPIVGDWTGKGYDSVGVFRAGVFLLRNTNTGGGPDLNFAFGSATDTPIVGQWLAPTFAAAHQ